MGVELFGLSHELYGMTDAVDAVFRQMLEGNLATVAVEVHTAVGSGIAVSGQCVVCAAGIVASTLTSVCSEEHAAGIHHFGSQLFEVTCL